MARSSYRTAQANRSRRLYAMYQAQDQMLKEKREMTATTDYMERYPDTFRRDLSAVRFRLDSLRMAQRHLKSDTPFGVRITLAREIRHLEIWAQQRAEDGNDATISS